MNFTDKAMGKKLFITIACIGLAGAAMAQHFNIDGEYRTRFVLNHGYKVPVKKESDVLMSFDQRARIRMDFTNDKLATRLTLQDARIWGGDNLYNSTGISGNTNALGIYEAWVEIKTSDQSSIRVGRQEWNLDDKIIFSKRDWWTSGLSYDALLYNIHGKGNRLFVNLGISYNNDGTNSGGIDNSTWTDQKIKTLNFLNTKVILGERTSFSAMFIHSGRVNSSNDDLLSTGTYGINTSLNKTMATTDGIFAGMSAYYQNGKDISVGSDGEYRNIRAYLVAADIGWRTFSKKLELSAGFELLSGRDYSNTGESYNNIRHSFDLHYGARFPYYGGNMNHFLVQDSYKTGTNGGGYLDPRVKMKAGITKKAIIELSYYAPLLTTRVRAHNEIDAVTGKPVGPETDEDGDPVYWSGNLGNYLDLVFTYKFNKEIILKSGFSYAAVSGIKNQMVFGYRDVAAKQLYEMGCSYFSWASLIVNLNLFAK